jgi:hypothetical protein
MESKFFYFGKTTFDRYFLRKEMWGYRQLKLSIHRDRTGGGVVCREAGGVKVEPSLRRFSGNCILMCDLERQSMGF